MRKLLNILFVWGAAMAIAACGNSSSNELKDGKAVAVPEVNEVEVVTLERTDFAHQLLSNGKLKADLELYGCGMEICPNDTLCQITSNNACVRYSFLTPSADWYELNYYDGLWGLGGGPLGSKRWCKTKWSSQHFIYATVFIIVQ